MLLKITQIISENLWLLGILFFVGLSIKAIRDRTKHQKKAEKKWKEAIEKRMNEPLTLHPEIDPTICSGCAACVTACPEGDILQLIDHAAVLVEPTKCVGHGQCEDACPVDAISLVFGTKTRGMQLPMVNGNYETNVPGLYIAGELGGMGLIRNAVKQGRLAAENAVEKLDKSVKADVDVLVVGAGPAGLASSVTCFGKQVKYLCIEQNKFGGTIYNFPKQKVVMSHPLDFPIIGQWKFPKNKVSKEELLEMWNAIREKTKLNLKEETKFNTLSKEGPIFKVETSQGPITAQKVILGMGVRGTPRKLGVPGEESSKVTYNLLDPSQYQNKWIAIVGAGNAALEAAQYLCKSNLRNKVFLLVRDSAIDRANEENQKLVFAYEKAKRLSIHFNASVSEIHDDHIKVVKDGKKFRLQNDYLFVFAGALLPFDFLRSLGIMIETKHGEPVKAG